MKLDRLSFAALSVILGLAGHLAAARADCVSSCDAATYCDSEMHASGECARKLNNCYIAECNKPSRKYGSIAYDPASGAVGWSYDFNGSTEAERSALGNCSRHGNGCQTVVTFYNSCAAVAAGADDRYATGEGNTSEQAQAEALAACKSEGGGACEIQAWSCTFP